MRSIRAVDMSFEAAFAAAILATSINLIMALATARRQKKEKILQKAFQRQQDVLERQQNEVKQRIQKVRDQWVPYFPGGRPITVGDYIDAYGYILTKPPTAEDPNPMLYYYPGGRPSRLLNLFVDPNHGCEIKPLKEVEIEAMNRAGVEPLFFMPESSRPAGLAEPRLHHS